MNIELVTKQDLEAFREQLLRDLTAMLSGKQPKDKQYLRSKEARELLHVSNGTLMNLRIKNILHPVKVAGIYYYSAEEIQNLLNGNKAA